MGLLTDTTQALRNLIERCDGPEGVRADGSNIDTQAAHAALDKAQTVLDGGYARSPVAPGK
jgi:hypothetical protein